MEFRILLVIISIFMVAASGCVQEDTNNSYQSFSGDKATSSSFSNNTTSPVSSAGEVTGKCYHVVDGDTIDVEGVGRVRLVGVNTPERGQPGYNEAKQYVKDQCLYQTVSLDVDDEKQKDKYGRTLAVVYVAGMNINQQLLKKGYAEIMYIPPSEFNPYAWL
jgi:micrococcal nuclease